MSYGYIDDYNKFKQKLGTRKTELNNKLSNLSLQEQDVLHFLELETYNAITMVKVTKKLKLIRIERREVKNELDEVSRVLDKFAKKGFKTKDDKVYQYRTKVMEEFTDKKTIKSCLD